MIRNVIALLLLTSQAFAGLPPTTLKGQGGSKVTTFNFQVPPGQATQVSGVDSLIETGNRNILPNPGFEGTTGWTASGGATTAINTTAVGTGVNGYDWDSNSASQTLTGTAVTIPNGLKGRNGVVSCNIYTVSGSATHLLKAYDGTNDVVSGSISSVSGSYIRTSLNFVFPSSGTITVRLTSVASNEPEIYVDDCYLGPADGFNLSQVNQATFLGQVRTPVTASCTWTTTSTSFASFSANASCPVATASGSVSAPATKIPGLVINNASPGEYLFVATGFFQHTAAGEGYYEFSDGTNVSGINGFYGSASGNQGVPSVIGKLSLTTAQSTWSIELKARINNGTNTLIDASSIADFVIQVYRFPSSSEVAYRPEINAAYYSGYHGSGCSAWTRTNTAYGAITDDASGCTLTDLAKSGITAATSGSVSPALALTLPRTGTYYACAQVVAGGGSAAVHQFRLWDGTTTIAEGSSDSTSDTTISLCGPYVASSLTPTLTVQCKATSGTCTINSGASDVSILWSVFPLTGNVPAPVLVGSVTNGSTGAMRVEAAKIAAPSAGSCVVTESGSSDWINGNGTSGSTGNCSMTFNTGIWSAAPVCTCSQSGSNSKICSINAAETTTTVVTQTVTDGGAASDSIISLHCIGPR